MMTIMKKVKCFAALAFCFSSTMLFSQNNDYLLVVGRDTVYKEEFLKTYQKNSSLEKATEKDLRDYLDLYTKFKLKVADGVDKQVDTSKNFARELNSYRNQSAQQYLIDREVTDELIGEAYEHSKYDVRASHILVSCNGDDPADTLAAYRKALEIRSKVMKKELSFSEAAVRFSADPSAKDRYVEQSHRTVPGNKGDLGYFTAFNMIYPFEVAVFNTPVGEISMPFRTSFGYHIVYVEDKVPAVENIVISQIYIEDSLAKNGEMTHETKVKFEEIAEKMKLRTASFEDLVLLYSDDRGTATEEKRGEVKPFAPQRRTGDFVKECLALKPGQCSRPFATHDGWFIVKMKEIKKLELTEEYKYSLKSRIQRDNRSYKSKESLVEKLKNEYAFNDAGAQKVIEFFANNLPSEFMQSTKINIDELPGINDLKPMFTFADQQVTALDYADYIRRYQGISNIQNMKHFVEERYPYFVNETILRYENEHLEKKYPEFNDLVKEYHDGMVLYEITSSEVWMKAVRDTAGLEKFYETVKQKYPVSQSDATPKALGEVKSAVITEYQDYLEQQWLEGLRSKYPVSVNEKVFATLLKK